MTDKQIIKPRPICLYEDTCLDLKEKTRLCEDCVHHKNYWSELLEKEQIEKIKSLEQECEELKEKYKWYDHYKEQALYNKNLCNEKSEQLDQLKQTLTEIKEIADKDFRHTAWEEYAKQLKQILQKISECEVKNAS